MAPHLRRQSHYRRRRGLLLRDTHAISLPFRPHFLCDDVRHSSTAPPMLPTPAPFPCRRHMNTRVLLAPSFPTRPRIPHDCRYFLCHASAGMGRMNGRLSSFRRNRASQNVAGIAVIHFGTATLFHYEFNFILPPAHRPSPFRQDFTRGQVTRFHGDRQRSFLPHIRLQARSFLEETKKAVIAIARVAHEAQSSAKAFTSGTAPMREAAASVVQCRVIVVAITENELVHAACFFSSAVLSI